MHQNRELWKKYLCCLESNNKYEHLMLKTLNHGWKNNLARKIRRSFALINVTSSHSILFKEKKRKRKDNNIVMLKKEWIEQGFINEPVSKDTDLKAEIRRLCEEKGAIILAHYYTIGDIQDIADFVGDSLALARKAAETDARMMVMCGVHFMAETCKLLSPDKKVLCPDLNAGCSLADSCKAEDLQKYKEEHPGYQVISYVNTTAAVKALTDVVVTSGNAKKVIDQLPKDAKLIFGPDYNLGNYINEVTGRQMLLWNGGCHVHERFSVSKIVELKKKYPQAVVMAHLECKGPVLALADVKGSTADMLREVKTNGAQQFIVATEAGILHELRRNNPDKEFIPVPPEISETGLECSCNECSYMKMNTLLKIYNCLKYEWPDIEIDAATAEDAVKPIRRMLELS